MSFCKRLLKRLLRRLLIGGTTGLLVVVLLDILAYPLYHQEPTSLNWFEQTLIKVDYQAAALQEDMVTYLAKGARSPTSRVRKDECGMNRAICFCYYLGVS
ncbi:hypothetical protein [Moorena producens]|uniref:hypothetical protein n=1 Tax=Moorena producens TaxID=1155739 RepID=UPI003C7361C7